MSAINEMHEREKPRKFWDPSRKLLQSIRQYQYYKSRNTLIAPYVSKLAVIRYQFWSVVTGADIPINTKMGQGLMIPHPNGIVIHPGVTIGSQCLIHQQVTIGVKRGNKTPPTIAANVDIGAGAKIIGAINIGESVLIGANSVVTKDVESYAIVAGVPAKVIGSTLETAERGQT